MHADDVFIGRHHIAFGGMVQLAFSNSLRRHVTSIYAPGLVSETSPLRDKSRREKNPIALENLHVGIDTGKS